jgi:hypothetical protein
MTSIVAAFLNQHLPRVGHTKWQSGFACAWLRQLDTGMTPKYSSVSKTHVVRALADDPDLKLISEQSPFMRSER